MIVCQLLLLCQNILLFFIFMKEEPLVNVAQCDVCTKFHENWSVVLMFDVCD